MRRCLGVHDIYRMVANCAAFVSSVDIAGQASTIGPNGVARVVTPDGIIDTDRVFSMPCGIEPLFCDSSAAFFIEIWLVFVTNRSWRRSPDEVTVYGIVESDPVYLFWPRRGLWSLIV